MLDENRMPQRHLRYFEISNILDQSAYDDLNIIMSLYLLHQFNLGFLAANNSSAWIDRGRCFEKIQTLNKSPLIF